MVSCDNTMLRCFLSPEDIPLAGSPALRLVCQAEKTCIGIICEFRSLFHYMLVIRKIKSKAVTTRWPSTPVAANWSGGRWRAESFLHQGATFELPWSAISSSSPVVMMVTSSPRSCPGTQLPKPGRRLATSLWGETAMQLSLFLLPSLNVDCKRI